MKMSEDQQKCFESWLRANCSNLKCALCQSVRWKIGDLLPPSHHNPLEQELGAHEPVMAQLVCKNCAHLVLFDVRRIKGWYDDGITDSSQTMIF
jgi:hypothetical protein